MGALTPMEFDDIGEGTFTPNTTVYGTGTVSFYRDRHIVTVKIAFNPKTALSGATSYTLGSVDLLPKTAGYYAANVGQDYNCCGFVVVSTNGTVQFRASQAIGTDKTIYCCGCYYVD